MTNIVPATTCDLCGIRFAGPVLFTHRNAYPTDHPLARCCDPMELQALGYKRRKSDGAYTADLTTDVHPSSARQLATFRQEREQYELEGTVPVHVRMVPRRWLDDSLAKPIKQSSPVAHSSPTGAQTAAKARRAKVAARVRRYRQRKASLGCVMGSRSRL